MSFDGSPPVFIVREKMINETYNTDCMEYLKTCADKQFDLAIVDPPYGNAGNETQFKGAGKTRFDCV